MDVSPRPRVGLAALALALVALGGGLLRLFAALRFAPHVDEGNSLLAAQMVAERGIPLLPSGVLYLHGATLSYLVGPLSLLGLADGGNLFVPRLVSVAAGTAAILLTYRLARMVVGPGWAPILAAFLVALDPISVLWSGRLRMYSLLQVVVLVLAGFFVAALSRPADRAGRGPDRVLVGMVVAFWLAVFTQLSAALLWPAMLLAAWAVCGRTLLRERRGLLGALGLCLLAPPVFMLLGALVGPGNSSARAGQGAGLPVGSFLGDDIISFRGLLEPTLGGWTSFFNAGWFAALVPAALAILSGVVVGRVLRGPRPRSGAPGNGPGLVALLALYWVPILLFAFVSAEPRERYLLYVQPLGAVLAVAALALLLAPLRAPSAAGSGVRLGAALAVVLGALVAANVASGVFALDDRYQENDPNSVPALRYVAERRAPGETVVVGSPPEAYLVLGGAGPVAVVGGALPLQTASGEVDYWIGWPKVDTAGLCDLLAAPAPPWFVLEDSFLAEPRRASEVIAGATDEAMRTADGMVVLRGRAPAAWNEVARAECG